MAVQKKKKKKSNISTYIFLAVLAIGIIVVYFFGSQKKDDEKLEIDNKQTEAEILLEKDIEAEYPPTVREVIKLYCRYVKCVYNDELTDDQVTQMAEKIRLLYDNDLLGANTPEQHAMTLQADKAHYKANEMIINSYSIDKSSRIEYNTTSNGEFASIKLYFTIKEGTNFDRAFEKFLLRKDNEGSWKIYGWQKIEDTEIIDE